MTVWTRPPGCQCDEADPPKDRCSDEWMRCDSRIGYEATQRAVAKAEHVMRGACPSCGLVQRPCGCVA